MSVIIDTKKRSRDLSETKGTYSKCLGDGMQKINAAYADGSVGEEEFRSLILSVVSEANDTIALRNFVDNVKAKHGKTQLVEYVYNAYMRGSGMGVRLDDEFAHNGGRR